MPVPLPRFCRSLLARSTSSGQAGSDNSIKAIPPRRGFTLIEVLVGLAIFALAAVMLGATYVNVLTSYDAVSRRNEHDQDIRLVRAPLLAEPERKKAEEGGEVPLPNNRTAHWEVKIEEGTVADLFRVNFRCEIRDPARAQPWVKEETFMLLRPTWSDPAIRDKLRQTSRERLAKREPPK